MIRIFNNIRQQLAAEGKLMRYLGYAVGDIEARFFDHWIPVIIDSDQRTTSESH